MAGKKIIKKRGPKPKEVEVQNVVDAMEDRAEEIQEGSTEMNTNKSVNFLPTGITLYDLMLGGGYPLGKIVNVVGDNSTGKTLLNLECLAFNKKLMKNKLKFFYDDAESGFSFDAKKMYGVDLFRDNQKNSTKVEEFDYSLSKEIETLKKDGTLLYILDSLDALSSQAESDRNDERIKAMDDDKTYDKGTFAMERQKMLSEMFRLKSSKIGDKNVTVVIISQVRANIGVMFGEKYTRTGGKALDFYASQAIWLAVAKKKEKEGRVIGVRIKAKTKKNKVGTPFRDCFIDVLFDYGVDNVTSNLNFLYDLLTPQGEEKSKRLVCEWEGKEYKIKDLIDYIEKENLEDELAKRVIKKWNEIEDKISSKRKSKW
jgi:recombination protein RecA